MNNNNNHTTHSLERIQERLEDAGIAEANIRTLAAILDNVAATQNGNVAIKALTLKGQVNAAYGNRSNGDTVYAIVRNRKITTVFLRRSTQPSTPAALRVDRVRSLKALVA